MDVCLRLHKLKYLSVYWSDMQNLQDEHPQAHQLLSEGYLSVQRNSHHGFSMVAVDQTIEQTVNKNAKSKGGIIGFSLKQGAVQRWLMTAHERAAVIDKCRSMTGLTAQTTTHKDESCLRIAQDEQDVQKVKQVIESWVNPFLPSEDMSSLASGYIAGEVTKKDMLKARDTGNTALQNFCRERIVTTEVDFFKPLPKHKLGVMEISHPGKKENAAVADANLFARMLVVAQTRNLDLRSVLTHELNPIPWSLATSDGGLRKNTKSTITSLIEDGSGVPISNGTYTFQRKTLK